MSPQIEASARRRSRRRDAFSLVELLVAAAVLVLVAFVLLSMADSTARITRISNLRMGADAGSREALDRLGADFSSALMRGDLPDYVEKLSGNDRLVFHSQVGGYGGDRGVSRVSYLMFDHPVVTNDIDIGLLRAAEGAAWDSGTNSLAFGTNAISTATDASKLEVAASDIFRFEVAFLMGDGRIRPTSQSPGAGANEWLLPSDDSTPPDQRVTALIIGVAALDAKSRALLPAGGMDDLVTMFPDAGSGPGDLLSQWKNIDGGTNLPPPVRNAVRIYQRYFDLQPLQK